MTSDDVPKQSNRVGIVITPADKQPILSYRKNNVIIIRRPDTTFINLVHRAVRKELGCSKTYQPPPECGELDIGLATFTPFSQSQLQTHPIHPINAPSGVGDDHPAIG